MAKDKKIKEVIRAGIITAFTFVTALIWRDVLVQSIEIFVPLGEELKYKFLLATIATLVLMLVIFIIMKTESEVEYLWDKLNTHKKKINKLEEEIKQEKRKYRNKGKSK